MNNYAIINLGGKQYVVKEGETLLVDRLDREEGKTFQPDVLFVGGDGDGELAPSTHGERQGRRARARPEGAGSASTSRRPATSGTRASARR